MSAESRQCPNCHGIFLPPAVPESNPVQCPHCAHVVPLGQCAVVTLDWQPVQEAAVRDERAEEREEVRAQHSNWLRHGGLVLAALAVLGAGVFWWQQRNGGHTGGGGTAAAESVLRTEEEKKVDAAAAMLAVRGALEAPDVDAMLPWVRDRTRVEPVMRWVTRYFPAAMQPVKVTGPDKVESGYSPGGEWLRLRVETPANPTRWLWVLKTPEGWRLDWEDYAQPERLRLTWFLKQPPGTEIECRLMATRAPVPDSAYTQSGYSPETHRAIYISARQGGEKALAFLPAGGPLWTKLDGIDWNTGVMFSGKIRRLTLQADPVLVELLDIPQRGWGTPTDATAAE